MCEGLAEELIIALSKIKSLKVISRTSSFRFKDTEEDVLSIAKRLNTSYILEGQLSTYDGRLRIHTQLIDMNWEEGSSYYERFKNATTKPAPPIDTPSSPRSALPFACLEHWPIPSYCESCAHRQKCLGKADL